MIYSDELNNEEIGKLNSSYLENEKFERLKYIYETCIAKFHDNINRFENKKVKYILFGEAPPWSPEGVPAYFYSKIETKLHKSFWKTFYNAPVPLEMDEAYLKLIDKGFLLIDSIPYPLKYSGRVRDKKVYRDLIREYLTSIMKILNNRLIFDVDVKIAFAFKKNGQAIIQSMGGVIKIGQSNIDLNEEMIAADGSGFPKPKNLKSVFEIQ